MMRLDRMHDGRLFAESAGKIGTDDRMAALDFMVDGLPEVMKETRTLCRNGIKAKLGRHDSGQVRNFQRVVKHVLAIRGTVTQTSKRTHELGMQIMDSGIECSLIAGLLHALVHELRPCQTSLRCGQDGYGHLR